jgi:Fic family protein
MGGETQRWVAFDDGFTSRRSLAAASGEYMSAIPASISDYAPAIPSALAAEVEEATAALVRFDLYAAARLGSASPTLGPMSAVLLRTESASSSQIEHLTAGARQLAVAELGEARSGNAQEVLGNVRAMEAALRLADDLDESAILAMHQALLHDQRGWEGRAGRYREQLVWVGRSGVSPIGASHVAPQAELVPAAMADLVTFIHRLDVPVLIQAAIAHAQFETIHPFADGNGRTGRALVHALLKAAGVVTRTTAPISAGLLTDTATYVSALTTYRAGDAGPIVERFCDASQVAASSGARLVDDLTAELDRAEQRVEHLNAQAGARSIVPHLIAHPVLNSHFVVERIGLGRDSARRALDHLTEAGVLVERTGQSRNRLWEHPGILRVLDHYAEGLRRG